MNHEIKLSDMTVDTLLKGEECRELIAQDMLEHPQVLETMLAPFCVYPRGTVMAGEFKIDAEMMGLDGKSGTVVIEFTEEAYYGCRDMDRVEVRDEEISFSIDPTGKTLTFHPIELPSRDDEL